MAEEAVSKNFIEQEIEKDLAEGVYDHVCTRFPPEPNGYLHIGHAKSILLNYGLAQKYNGTFHMRFDDTNPTKEKTEFVESIKADIKWLGADWGDHLYFASDYFDQMYEYAIKLIKKGKAYVCDLTADQIREYRGTLTEPGKDSPYRDRNSSKGGSGIGLSIVKKIMEDHGGKVWATSRLGIGTIMYFVLRKYQEVPMNE